MTSSSTPRLIDSTGAELDLVLYKFDFCPFCVRVQQAIKRLGLAIPARDTRQDPSAQAELIEIGGKSQVPMLLINGKPLYESADIIRFLEKEVRLAPA